MPRSFNAFWAQVSKQQAPRLTYETHAYAGLVLSKQRLAIIALRGAAQVL